MINNFEKNNQVEIKGKLASEPVYSHSVMGEGFYECDLIVPRLSSQVDVLPITISERLLTEIPDRNKEIGFLGQLRSYNKLDGERSRLILTIFAREIVPADTIENGNHISMTGYVCKEPIYRTTPFGREITDILIAVNRAYNKSDYLPCIAWGRNARFTGDLSIGDKVTINGRIQSRVYQKKLEDESVVNKTAYEVSISTIVLEEEQKNEEIVEQNYEPVLKENHNVIWFIKFFYEKRSSNWTSFIF